MPTVTLRQGIYNGASKGGIHLYNDIPYARPFTKRFEPPQPPPASNKEFCAKDLASNYRQLPSRLEFVVGNWHPSTKYDEKGSAVLSVYAPENTGSADPLPVILWIHGGAWVSGGSQLLNYDGTKLAQDAGAIVVCINYRLGALNFLYHEDRSLNNGAELPACMADVVAAFEWVRANIHAFGGDPSNITSIGQSAGAHTTQALLATRPDFLDKAVLISTPAGFTNPPWSAVKAREDLIEYLPEHATPETTSVEALLEAQMKAMLANPGSPSAWGPTTTIALVSKNPRGGRAFLHLALPDIPVAELSNILTDQVFREPSIALAKQLREQGHAVTTFELTWAPEDFAFGPTHCIDLPLTFGFEAWSRSAMCWEKDMNEWERRGKRWRQQLGHFARDGEPFVTEDSVKMF